jgi:hypothetical protein
MRCTELAETPAAAAIIAAVQWVVSAGGAPCVRATTRSAISVPSGGMRDGRVLSRNRPSTPSSAKRSCQRQTQVFALPVRRMISTVPSPSAESSTISARQACFCGVLRSRTSASRRVRSEAESSKPMPVRKRQTRMSTPAAESHSGFKCQVLSSSLAN